LKDYQQELKFLVPFLESKAKSNNFCDTDVIKYIALGNISKLNYAKIVNHIIKNPSSRSSALLLQALRQQITRTPTKDVAVETIKLFANKDILLLKVKKNSILSNVMINHEGNNMEVREEIARFINAIASFQVGRSYLVKIYHGQDFIYQLVNGLKSRRINGHSADHAISALQKLSVKSNAQKELFQNGMIDWLVVELHNIRQSKTFIEFGTALLLNLCLVSSSQSAILRVNCEITSLMSSLLELQNSHLNVYIYHLLFVIFQFRKVRQNSIENGFLEILEKQKNGILSYQEQCVLTFLECCLNEGEFCVYKIFKYQDKFKKKQDLDFDTIFRFIQMYESMDQHFLPFCHIFHWILLKK
uniref:Armadillo-type fold,Armadillo-like helical n=1 Tax=Rhabditophanes sp. KR3021 TaxID=114890 RepID=A0AC35U5I3_9BILA